MGVEYGSCGKIGFANMESRMVDSTGNEILCKCGNPSSGGMIGVESFLVWCRECDPNKSEYVSDFVYKPPLCAEEPTKVPFVKISSGGSIYIEHSWLVDLNKNEDVRGDDDQTKN